MKKPGMQESSKPSEEHDVFVSYQSSDSKESEQLVKRLERETIDARRFKVFFAPWDITPGANFVEQIDSALSKAAFFIIILSPEALKASWPSAERAAAILSDPSGRLGRVIPVIVKDCKLPPLLAFRQYIDLRDKSKIDYEMIKLLSILRHERLPRGTKSVVGSTSQTSNQASVNKANELTESSEPDEVEESIHSNLFPIEECPEVVWRAPTPFRTKKEIFQYFGTKPLPAFILREGELCSFVDLSSERHQFSGVTEDYNTRCENLSEWRNDPYRARWEVSLFNDSIRSHCRSMRFRFDEIGERHYFSRGVLRQNLVSWTPHLRRASRSLILPHKNQEGRIDFFAHRAVSLRFLLLEGQELLRIEPGWVFSFDGANLITGRRRAVLSTRYLSRQKNLQNLDETRFWAWLLSVDGKTIKIDLGGPLLHVATMPLTVSINKGVFGDSKPIPPHPGIPPSLFDLPPTEDEEEEEESKTYE